LSKPSVKSPSGGATERSVASSEACRVVKVPIVRWGKGEPSPECQGEGHGNGEDPGIAAVRNSSA
jgi:hypothetical protein